MDSKDKISKTKVEITGFITNISSKTTIFTPIIEAVVNAIHAIQEISSQQGKITVEFIREDRGMLGAIGQPSIQDIIIRDNGAGFNERNQDSFETIYSKLKAYIGAKGFGRMTYLKYFNDVTIESVFKDANNDYYKRTFSFVPEKNIIKNEELIEADEQTTYSIVCLKNIKKEYINNLPKELDTIAKNLLEKLLIYFISDKEKIPQIELVNIDGTSRSSIVLNDYLNTNWKIKEVFAEDFILEKGGKKEQFSMKGFKIFHTQSSSSIHLCAHSREVTNEKLHTYVPEFKDDFIEVEHGNYTIKTYVIGKYLDDNVNNERNKFNFSQKGAEDIEYYPFTRLDIEAKVAILVKEKFKDIVQTRQAEKKKKVVNYIDSKAPFHKRLVQELDTTAWATDLTEEGMEIEIQKHLSRKERWAQANVHAIVDSKIVDKEKLDEIIKAIDISSKDRLAHYVALRKVILEIFEKALSRDENKDFEEEKTIHNLIFPMKKTSEEVDYHDHNLWIVDERLVFNELVTSDLPLEETGDRPDTVVFHKNIALREGNEFHNPLTVLEFKRPERNRYSKEEDPIIQMGKYIEQIRDGKKVMNSTGRAIQANNNTPAYGYLICDITPKIQQFAKIHQLKESPDNKGYFGYHIGFEMYVEIISFDKLLIDAKQRNRVFFEKLGIV